MNNPAKILNVCVLGGTGFIGTELIARLNAAGHRVRVLTRKLAAASHLRVLPGVEVSVANVHAPAVLVAAFAGIDVVINLVGILNESGRSGAGFRRAHTELAASIVTAAHATRVKRLLQMSSLGARIDGPSHYLRSRGAAEQHIDAHAGRLDYHIFRPSVVFGDGDSLTNRFASLLRLSGGWLPLAKPDTRFAPVYVGDVAEAFVRCLHGGPVDGAPPDARRYQLCGPDILSLEQLVRLTANYAALPSHILRLPDFVARIQAAVMDFVPGKPFSTDNYRSLSEDSVCSSGGLLRLGIRPRSMAAVLPTYLGSASRESRLDAARRRAGR
ncbi:MAG TPA: complex I NDUFA9 subunit family protein [Steroidobacteraceae bacterium]|nr:complex I NDUFA9 subunit family protein [Steroidobacteraceae bacterium]HRX89092.1 complex I NDUFA9 subunit family protein [Steroidobacteraceae bacterium]